MKTTKVTTESGSLYIVHEDVNGNFFLQDNVANPFSEKMDPNKLCRLVKQPSPWPPTVGERLFLPIVSPREGVDIRLKTTIPVTSMEEA